MNIEEINVDMMCDKIEGYAKTFKAFKDAEEFLTNLKGLKQLKGSLTDDIASLKASAESLEAENHAAQEKIDASYSEADLIIERAEAAADKIVNASKEQGAKNIADAMEKIEKTWAPVTEELNRAKNEIKQLNIVIDTTRFELENLRKEREDTARNIEALKEQKSKLLEAFK